MGLMKEYIDKRWNIDAYEIELLRLIAEYNKISKRYLLIYSADISKPQFQNSIDMDDYYIISDLLNEQSKYREIDVYLETPGGSGEATEAIANLLHRHHDSVNYVIAGEAKSAGTIMALSGNEIYMTETGSLGPIDAQSRIGRSVVSAHDYMEWVKTKQEEAKNGGLNHFDATMVAQISPGEIYGIQNALEFAVDLVTDWLPKYKFSKWSITESSHKKVTLDMKKKRAKEIAKNLTDHTKWRSHGRSLGIDELNNIKLHIEPVPEKLLETIKRIQVVIKLLYFSSGIYKIFATESEKIFRIANSGTPIPIAPRPSIIPFQLNCAKCGKTHKLYAKLEENPANEASIKVQGFKPFPKSNKLLCNCGFEIDLIGIKNQIEASHGKMMV